MSGSVTYCCMLPHLPSCAPNFCSVIRLRLSGKKYGPLPDKVSVEYFCMLHSSLHGIPLFFSRRSFAERILFASRLFRLTGRKQMGGGGTFPLIRQEPWLVRHGYIPLYPSFVRFPVSVIRLSGCIISVPGKRQPRRGGKG